MNIIKEISEINSVYGACACLGREGAISLMRGFNYRSYSFVATSNNDSCGQKCCIEKNAYAYVKEVNVETRNEYYPRFRGDFNGISGVHDRGGDYYVHSYFTYCKNIENFFKYPE